MFSVNFLLQENYNFVQELDIFSLLITAPFLIMLSFLKKAPLVSPYSVTTLWPQENSVIAPEVVLRLLFACVFFLTKL